MAVDLGPRLGLLVNANINDPYYDQFRPFLRAIDALLLGAVINSTTTIPPSSPSNGDAYLLLGTPTGAWAGQLNNIAVWSTEITSPGTNTKVPGWEFHVPNSGWTIWDTALSVLQVFFTSQWRNLLFNVPQLGNTNNWTGFQGFVGGFLSASDILLEGQGSATSGANISSSSLGTLGFYWNGTSSQTDRWNWQNVLGTGTNPTSTLTLIHTGSTGVAKVAIPALSLTASTTTTSASSGAATALPATPAGYVSVTISGTVVKIPYYN